MHVIFRESHGLEESETPVDLGQTPADLIVLSFSDSDLGAFAEGWHRAAGGLPSLRLANLAHLKHPLSVDTYVERTLAHAKGVLIRLIGGVSYWRYGLAEVARVAREKGIALAVVPGDGRPDPQLDQASTVPISTLRRLKELCDAGGALAAQAALQQLALAAGLYAPPVRGAKALAALGGWTADHGLSCPVWAEIEGLLPGAKPLVVIVFYRAFLAAADLKPIEALSAALTARGFRTFGLFVPSLKAPEAREWIARQIAALSPRAIVNATAFSARAGEGASPLERADVPIFQIALATARRAAWEASPRGLSPADLAMHVVLPEVDGRLFAGVASFKEAEPRDEALEFSRLIHAPEPERIDKIAARVAAWVNLAAKPAKARRFALVLSTYPGKAWNLAHAVGLDALASAEAILSDLAAAGHDVRPGQGLAAELSQAALLWPLAAYQEALATLPEELREALHSAWGPPEADPEVTDGNFRFRAVVRGNAVVALQPERALSEVRKDAYHDLTRVPRHSYVAFYLWLQRSVDALIHLGAHGTLEWLPGKTVALSNRCWPEVLVGVLPVIYPFIVNDPGEAAQAKRRIGAVTLGHLPPPQQKAALPPRLSRLEALLDEFSNADGLDPRRRDRLAVDIRAEARSLGLEADLGIPEGASLQEALTRIDRFVCDLKESQFNDGLHVWGRAPAAATPFNSQVAARAEREALLAAVAGRFVPPGPSGSPYRGRRDVLPTGRNLFTVDPRAVPTRAAFRQGAALAEELLRRHLQDEGDWPKGVFVDLWGSATMRTAGEDFAMALALIGVKPTWDEGNERVVGFEIVPLAELDRPRIDVTLRISGLFRDVFPTLTELFQAAVRALSQRDEAAEWNPFVLAPGPRVFGPRPGSFGLGIGALLSETHSGEEGRCFIHEAGQAWFEASSWAHEGGRANPDPEGLRAQLVRADAFVHAQDLPETDLLFAEDYATHIGGFSAAKALFGGKARLWYLDNTNPGHPRARALAEELARVVLARAANPAWIAGMRRHGFRGAAEIAATLEHLAAFAELTGAVGAHLFDAFWEATLGEPNVAAFLAKANPGALAAMQARFAALYAKGLWQSRRNAIVAALQKTG